MKKTLLFLSLTIVGFFSLFFLFLFAGNAPLAEDIIWGVNFSFKQAERLSLDWREVYENALTDLKAKHIRVAVHWDAVEADKNQFFFEDIDWMMERAREEGAEVILAVGMKTPRWPECHVPSWAATLPQLEQQKEISEMLTALVTRYRDHEALGAWQVENEPLFPFGECPWMDSTFLKDEISLVQSLDSGHDVFTSDSGELSFWWQAATLGDKVAVTLYQKAWFEPLKRYVDYPLPPVFYGRKAWLVEQVFGKEVFVGELQAEPWTPFALEDASLTEQAKTMDIARFKDNIAFAKETGLDTFYLWGTEWWYWLKEVHGNDEILKEAKKLF